jgi:hypothetical protein
MQIGLKRDDGAINFKLTKSFSKTSSSEMKQQSRIPIFSNRLRKTPCKTLMSHIHVRLFCTAVNLPPLELKPLSVIHICGNCFAYQLQGKTQPSRRLHNWKWNGCSFLSETKRQLNARCINISVKILEIFCRLSDS